MTVIKDYGWKVDGLYPVSAQVAGENIEPQDLIDASRPDDAPLHNCFEWDDTAAELRDFRRKYAIYSELAKVFSAIDDFVNELDG